MRLLLLFIGGRRMDALWRLWAFLYMLFIASIVAGLATLAGIVWGLIDIVWQFFLDSEGLSEESRGAALIVDTLSWNHELLLYSLTGKGEFMWLPDL